jgi:hypothetical protein
MSSMGGGGGEGEGNGEGEGRGIGRRKTRFTKYGEVREGGLETKSEKNDRGEKGA